MWRNFMFWFGFWSSAYRATVRPTTIIIIIIIMVISDYPLIITIVRADEISMLKIILTMYIILIVYIQ